MKSFKHILKETFKLQQLQTYKYCILNFLLSIIKVPKLLKYFTLVLVDVYIVFIFPEQLNAFPFLDSLQIVITYKIFLQNRVFSYMTTKQSSNLRYFAIDAIRPSSILFICVLPDILPQHQVQSQSRAKYRTRYCSICFGLFSFFPSETTPIYFHYLSLQKSIVSQDIFQFEFADFFLSLDSVYESLARKPFKTGCVLLRYN